MTASAKGPAFVFYRSSDINLPVRISSLQHNLLLVQYHLLQRLAALAVQSQGISINRMHLSISQSTQRLRR